MAALPPDPGSLRSSELWTDAATRELLGYDFPTLTTFVGSVTGSHGGSSFHPLLPDGKPPLVAWNDSGGWRADWPGFEDVVAFAYDWLGRLYVLESTKFADGEPTVSRIEPGIGELRSSGLGFTTFVGDALGERAADTLALDYLADYLESGRGPLSDGKVAGFTIPLFLGGLDDVPNLTPSDLAVYVSLSGQLAQQAPAIGSKVRRVRLTK